MKAMLKLAPWITYPLVVGGSVVGAVALLDSGLGAEVVVPIVSAMALCVIVALERLLPYSAQWGRSHGDFWTDGVHATVSMVLIPEGLRLLLLGALTAASASITAWVGMGLWPTGLPWLAQLALAILITELVQYWTHRWMHTIEPLWRLHAIHHSAPRLYWLNSGRFHPFDAVVTWASSMPALWLLGCPEPVVALYLVFTTSHGPLQHANVDVRLGPLNWLICQGELHRWHHSPDMAEGNHNYGSLLILWDVIFGTRMLPPDRRPPEDLGIGGMPDFPADYLGQLAAPFRWARLPRVQASAPAPDRGQTEG